MTVDRPVVGPPDQLGRRARSSRWTLGRDLSLGDYLLRAVGGLAALFPIATVVFIAVLLLVRAMPSIRYNGLDFLTHSQWAFGNFYSSGTTVQGGVSAPLGAAYGALPFIAGTFFTSIIALIIGVPVALGAALILTEHVPPTLRRWLSLFLELLAGIPSVVYGLWGLIILAPFLAQHVYPAIAHLGVVVPWLGGPVGPGLGLLTAGLILSIMIVPIVASTSRDLLAQVPALPREGAAALGMTSWESVRVVSLPWVSQGIVGAIILGWGRALGETMAVLIVSGNGANALPSNIFAPVTTIASAIVALLDSALSDPTGMAVSALAEIGLILMLITLLTNVLARLLVRRVTTTTLPVGRGI
ncbi:MAG TPA: phosphate ABC transporter permease subunit PstC [Thermomicrobiaceae bacterium]|nr:phosphate ABC transporter permease subunit PstC [Thermomicrobiaceae bacterium]